MFDEPLLKGQVVTAQSAKAHNPPAAEMRLSGGHP